jgi:hypothetical protein
MRNILVGIFVLSVAASLAHADASGEPPWPKLYASYRPTFTGDEKAARDAVAGIVKSCRTPRISRIGPSEAEVARCQKAERRALALGTDGAQAAFATLDQEKVAFSEGVEHLYDLIARAGDPRTIAPLVAALERIEKGGQAMQDRQWESTTIGDTLRALTFSAIGFQDRWDNQSLHVLAWRAWIESHRGMTRAQLLAARTAEAQRDKGAANPWTALAAAEFLAGQTATRAEGVAAIQAIAKRPNLDNGVRSEVENATIGVPTVEDRPVADDRRV